MEVLPPGWNSVFQYAYFEYDERFVNYLAQSVATEYEQELSLLGLWHRHPGSMDTFSGTDDGTNRTFANLNPKGAISGLVNIDPKFRLTMYHVSTPLRYERVAIEVGDDLIPEKYFKLKYEPSLGLNPQLPEKKNLSQNTVRKYGIRSDENYNMFLRYLNSKNLFLLIFVVGLALSSFSFYAYDKLKGSDDVKALYKVFYSREAIVIPRTDSIKNVFETEFEKTRSVKRAEMKNTITLSTKDSIKLNDSLAFIRWFVLIVNNLSKNTNIDSLTSAFIDKKMVDIKESTIAQQVENWKKDNTRQLISREASGEKVHFSIILLSIATLLSLLLVFIPHKNRWINEWFVIVSALVVSTLAIYLLSCGFALISLIYTLALFIILCLLVFVALFSLKLFNFPKKKDRRFWFQKNPTLYMEEEKQIKARFSRVEKNVENGVLSFDIPTDRRINGQSEALFFQLVYSSDYGNDREIKIYLITPDLDNLFVGNAKKDSNVVKIDGAGESYLDFGKLIPKDKINGMEVIRKLYEWLHNVETL
jgi:hypothetical protein